MRIAPPDKCTACMACVDVCNWHVLDATMDEDGYYRIVATHLEACTECGMCTKVCPVLDPIKDIKEEQHPYAAWNTNQRQRERSASGGAFAALAATILKQQGVVYGAAIEGFNVVHHRVSSLKDLPTLQGTKYQASNLTDIYKEVRKDVRSGKPVLFSGLGCQVAGLMKFIGRTPHDNLFTLDVICGGISTMLPMLRLKATGKYTGIDSFRNKERGWKSEGFRYDLRLVRKDGSTEDLGSDNLVLATFSSKALKRDSCMDCQFTTPHRCSDATIGDFWGDHAFPQEHPNGLSVLVLHNQRLDAIIKQSELQTKAIKASDFIRRNHNYDWGKSLQFLFAPIKRQALKAIRQNQLTKAASLLKGKNLYFIGKVDYLYRKVCQQL